MDISANKTYLLLTSNYLERTDDFSRIHRAYDLKKDTSLLLNIVFIYLQVGSELNRQ